MRDSLRFPRAVIGKPALETFRWPPRRRALPAEILSPQCPATIRGRSQASTMRKIS